MSQATGSSAATRWLFRCVVVNMAVTLALTAILTAMGEPPGATARATAVGASASLAGGSVGADSWTAMAIAYEDYKSGSSDGLYNVLFDKGVKFQYPPSSLLLFDMMPSRLAATRPDTTDSALDRQASALLKAVAGAASMVATFMLVLLSVLIFELGLRRTDPAGYTMSPVRILLGVLLGCTFYPVVQGHILGQVQVFLNLLIAVAVLGFMTGRHAVAGVALGVCSLIKPQCLVLLGWAVLRRHWSFVGSAACVLLVGSVLAILRFGWQAHWEYFEALQVIGRHGETYWPNQSVNGLVNRLLLNGDPLVWQAKAYAPFNRLVYLATVVSSVAFLMVALWPFARRASERTDYALLDLLVMLLTATVATPVAWEHHYGVLLPVLAAAVPIVMMARPLGDWTGPTLLAAAAATANVVPKPELLAGHPLTGLALSHLFVGATVILAVMVAARRQLSLPLHGERNRDPMGIDGPALVGAGARGLRSV